MLDPTQLFRFEADTAMRDLRASTLIVSTGSFIDAGHTQRLMTQHILGTLEHSVVATFDLDQLLDYRGRRPAMTFDRDRYSEYDDPALILYRVLDADGTPFLVLHGLEPDYQWERVIEAVRTLAQLLGVSLMVTANGIPMAVPHTRPIGMTRFSSNQTLLTDNEPLFSNVQVPSSLESLMHLRLTESGFDTAGFAIHVPHYLTQVDYGDAAMAALDAICGLTGLAIPSQELAALAGLHRADITKQIEDNDEVSDVIHGLEKQYDSFTEGRRRRSLLAKEMSSLPSAEEIGAELEQFLRTSHDEPGSASGPSTSDRGSQLPPSVQPGGHAVNHPHDQLSDDTHRGAGSHDADSNGDENIRDTPPDAPAHDSDGDNATES